MQRGIIGAIIVGLIYFGLAKPMCGEFDYRKAKEAIIANNPELGIQYLNQALSYDPRNTLYLQQLAQLHLFAFKDYKKAKELLLDSMSDFNGDATGWSAPLLIGICDLQMGELDLAGQRIKAALRYNPNHVEGKKIWEALEERKKK